MIRRNTFFLLEHQYRVPLLGHWLLFPFLPTRRRFDPPEQGQQPPMPTKIEQGPVIINTNFTITTKIFFFTT